MGRNSGNQETWDDFEHDEVDTFHEQRDKELERKASSGKRRNAHDDEEDFSDEEIMGLKGAGYSDEEENEDDDLDDDEFEGGGAEEDEEDEEGGWGSKRSDYYGADDLENDEDKQEEEAEALRLQKKHLSEMKASDFFEEDDFKEWEKSAKELESTSATDQHVLESLPTQDAAELTVEERSKLLDTVYPEAKPLAEELVTLLPQLEKLKESSTSESDQPELQLASLKFKSLSAYLGTINAYFSLLIANISAGGNKINLKEHAVMEGILKGREVWRTVSGLEVGDGENDINEDVEEDDIFNTDSLVKSARSAGKRKRATEDDDDAEEDEEQFQALESDSEDEEQQVSEQDEIQDSDFDIEIPVISKQTHKRKKGSSVSDFGESNSISKADLADKLSSKRNLRYYTAKIDQQSAKVREKLTGDSDLPYKERRFERQQRLNEEARKRGQQDADNFGSDNEDDEKTAREVRDSYDDDYYNMVAAGTKQKKIDRKEAHAAAIQAAKEGRLDELQDEIGENGKRAINYQILKNKGLTPKRKKEDRNARVKKRKKYEQAKKKLSSVRRVYKQPTASYGGEETGIKKNMVRSVKFS
ncbi:hypothetical protein D0Z03_002769 [Geotrichum reessii]|nr:hypothetical protein D0Z03_002769 [Galactomyces reessii]